MDLKGDLFDEGQEGDPYYKFPPLYPRKKPGKVGKTVNV
jgi:hypothetical protein